MDEARPGQDPQHPGQALAKALEALLQHLPTVHTDLLVLAESKTMRGCLWVLKKMVSVWCQCGKKLKVVFRFSIVYMKLITRAIKIDNWQLFQRDGDAEIHE